MEKVVDYRTDETLAGIPTRRIAWEVEGCGPDRQIRSTTPERAARRAARRQHGPDVQLEWTGMGPDRAVARYQVVGMPGIAGRITVRVAR